MTAVLLDTHAMHWWFAEPQRLSPAAGLAISAVDEIVVASITWYELAWLATNDRIDIDVPLAAWLARMAAAVRTVGITPAIAATATSLPPSFPRDPSDRIIYATAIEHGWPLVTKDRGIRDHAGVGPGVIW